MRVGMAKRLWESRQAPGSTSSQESGRRLEGPRMHSFQA